MLHCDGDECGTTIIDSSSGGHSAVAIGTGAYLTRTQKAFGLGSLSFNGTSGYVQFSDHDDFFVVENSGEYSYDFRFRVNHTTGPYTIYEQYADASNYTRIYVANSALYYEVFLTASKIQLYSTLYGGAGTGALSADTWYHAQIVYNTAAGANRHANLFLDGRKMASDATTTKPTNYTSDVYIGKRMFDGAAEFYDGYLDEFRISKHTVRIPSITGSPRPFSFSLPTAPYSIERMAWGVDKEFLASATTEFLNLQSGNATPFFYIEAIVSGVTAVLGNSFTSTNYVIDGGTIDRQRPMFPGERSRIFSSDVTIKLSNSDQQFSPLVTGSTFYDNDYLESTVNYYAGFTNISGTALLLQRGSFLLENLKIDGKASVAYLRLRDKFKRALDKDIGYDTSGTAVGLTFTGAHNGKAIMESLLITGAGLTAGDVNIQTAGSSFLDTSFNAQAIAPLLAKIVEACDGYMYTDRKGVVQFVSNEPVWGSSSSADFTATESGQIRKTLWEQRRSDRLNKVTINFGSGTEEAVVSEDASVTAYTENIDNDVIEDTGDAIAIASRLRDRYSGQVTRLELKNIWLPSLEIGNILEVHSNNPGVSAANYQVYRIQEEPTRGLMTLSLSDPVNTGKFGFLSHETGAAGAGEHSAVFAGSGATESGGWQEEWAFFSVEATGFDDDGDNNNAIDTGVSSSGAGGSGIEMHFAMY
jgi:hypothetical protein